MAANRPSTHAPHRRQRETRRQQDHRGHHPHRADRSEPNRRHHRCRRRLRRRSAVRGRVAGTRGLLARRLLGARLPARRRGRRRVRGIRLARRSVGCRAARKTIDDTIGVPHGVAELLEIVNLSCRRIHFVRLGNHRGVLVLFVVLLDVDPVQSSGVEILLTELRLRRSRKRELLDRIGCSRIDVGNTVRGHAGRSRTRLLRADIVGDR